MNTVLLALCLFVVAVAAETGIRERRLFFIKRCSSESDCGPNRCCLFNKYCAPKLRFKYAPCHLSGITQCGCRDGLECRVTKEFNILGQRVQMRQCMEAGRQLEVEKIEDEELKEMTESREKRFLLDRCTKETDCGDNRCCLFGRICAKKIPEGMTCYLTNRHKCGCQDGLVCKVTATITIPIIGSKIPIRQCVRE
ncbi:uncharacterized protein LOC116303311 [Actinia tenebrosa]|uniref:Uncharacterized protein LOC116303311 n=1 Tax=Actinia tenebrosa TaxID=6105 RepID=A0A6P8INS9_ACTTE|nr:uncharacterized protein LOC116303311 [Actinia tenebrosa]